MEQELFEPKLFTDLAVAYSNANAARIQSLMMSNDLDATYRVAEELARDAGRIFDEVTPTELARKTLHARCDDHEPDLLESRKVRLEMEQLVQGFRDAQDIAHSRPYLIQTLDEQGIAGSTYVRSLREEKEEPVLLLPASL